VIDTVPRVVAGGITNWMRSPVGSVAAEQRPLLVDLLVREGGDGGGERQAPLGGQLRRRRGFPSGDGFDQHFAGAVDAHLEDAGRVEPSAQRRRNSMTEVESPHQARAADASPSKGPSALIARPP
jgi:hypothetical protein